MPTNTKWKYNNSHSRCLVRLTCSITMVTGCPAGASELQEIDVHTTISRLHLGECVSILGDAKAAAASKTA